MLALFISKYPTGKFHLLLCNCFFRKLTLYYMHMSLIHLYIITYHTNIHRLNPLPRKYSSSVLYSLK